MTDFIIKKLPYDLTSNAGLALVGQYFKRLDIGKSLDRKFPIGGCDPEPPKISAHPDRAREAVCLRRRHLYRFSPRMMASRSMACPSRKT
jgi:hypothetical protein